MNLEHFGPFRILRQLGNKRQRVFEARRLVAPSETSGRDDSDTEPHESALAAQVANVQAAAGETRSAPDRSDRPDTSDTSDDLTESVAIKLISLPPDVSRDDALKKIHKEVRFLRRLRHPHLVEFYGAGLSEDRIYLEMEYVPGESLATIMSRRGRLAWDLAVQYASEIAEVLEYLHGQELLHSKLTPEKILVHQGHIKVTDLRLNRVRRRRWDAKQREELDVAAYLAPEQLLGEGASPQSDLYSLGAILYEMVTGKMPYPPESLKKMAHRKRHQTAPPVTRLAVDAPVWLDQVVENLLQPDPKRRYPSARAALLALREIQKIDANKTSAVAQMAGGFNPLTAGADKREARRLLGQHEEPVTRRKKKKLPTIPPAMQVALLGSGVVICGIIIAATVISLIPSYEGDIARAQRILAKAEPTIMEMRSVSNGLSSLLNRDPDHALAAEAEQLLEELYVKRLLRLARGGRIGLQEPKVKAFISAYQLALEDDHKRALEAYYELVDLLEPDNRDDGYLYRETLRQTQQVQQALAQEARDKLAEVAAPEQRSQGLVVAIEVAKALGNVPEFADWIDELTERFPELGGVSPRPWPPGSWEKDVADQPAEPAELGEDGEADQTDEAIVPRVPDDL